MLKKLKILLFIALSILFTENMMAKGALFNMESSSLSMEKDTLIKAMYIDNFFSADSSEILLGDSMAEQELFDYAENCGFNYMILYGLSQVPLGNNPDAVDALRSFVRRAHENYDMKVGCIGQSSKFFDRIHQKYQSLEIVDSIERLDSYNLEFEFWKSYNAGIYEGYYCDYYLEPNSYSCDSIGAFEFAMDEMVKIDSIAGILADTSLTEVPSVVSTEIYIGWINEYHAEVLADKMEQGIIDRILGAIYKPALEDGSLNLYYFYHQLRRMSFLGNQNTQIKFLPIFASKESEGNDLGDWLDSIGNVPYVYEDYTQDYLMDTSAYTENINLQGYVWYNYSNMPLCFDSLGAEGWLDGPEGELLKDSIYTFQVMDYENANRFYWVLPPGVSFVDSSFWEDAVDLQFAFNFNEGDSIMVRPANSCHLGKRQSFVIKAFDDIPEIKEEVFQIYYSNKQIFISSEISGAMGFKIYNLQGQYIREGEVFIEGGRGEIPFQNHKGYYLLQLSKQKINISLLFLIDE
ncbi:hypothetical protein [Lentimicrobium sp. S6]|uniref:hypothetical protein n=1 Tax=Lentimicrobium sp. S6 TaxID=2735872 RepID=UPI001554A689|nr:hypothetical protein [Lentimicrobium sp. S6]NPD46299.1 hypothetical protein [Lentimicrobium sp. S6]